MKKRRITGSLVAFALLVSLLVNAEAATGYKAIIVQGNTSDVNDCREFLEGLRQVPNGNVYVITNIGWQYNNGDSYHNYEMWPTTLPQYALAGAQHLIEAKNHDVLYWSGHGGVGPILNVHKSGECGPGKEQQPEIDISQTLGLDKDDWASASEWDKSSRLKVAIFAACNILHKDSCPTMVRAMKASNLRVIAGYHTTGPGHPTDTAIAEKFFYYVSKGNSVRASWQYANEVKGERDTWAVLCYKSNSNQYFGMPGFSENNYSAPASNAVVYRFRKGYESPTGGEEMTTSLVDDALPLEITVFNGNGRSVGSAGATVYREMNDDNQDYLDVATQRAFAQDYLDEKYQSGIEWIGTVYCEEVDEEIGVVPGTESEVGKTFCYSNQYNGVRLVDNFYKVATDTTGVYFTVDRWKDVTGYSEANTCNTAVLSADSIAVPYAEGESVENIELVYVPVNETTYRLCHAVTLSDGTTYYVDAVTGEAAELFVE